MAKTDLTNQRQGFERYGEDNLAYASNSIG